MTPPLPIPAAVQMTAERIASPPQTVREALAEIEAGAPASHVTARLEQAPEVAGRVLRIANAGFPYQTGSLNQAVVRVGERTLSVLLLAASVSRYHDGPLSRYGMGRGTFARHCESVARVAAGLAERACPRRASTARLAGVLHDIGKLVLAHTDRPGADAGPVRIHPGDTASERAAFGAGHDEVGAHVLRAWRAPDDLIEAVAEHHRPAVPDAPVSRCLWLADRLVHADGRPAACELVRPVCEQAGFDPAWISRRLGLDLRPSCPLSAPELTALRALWEWDGRADEAARAVRLGAGAYDRVIARCCRALGAGAPAHAIGIARRAGWIA